MNTEKNHERAFSEKNLWQSLKNLVGTLLMLALALALIIFILLPEMKTLAGSAEQPRDAMDLLFAAEGILVSGFLAGFPGYLVIQAMADCWNRPCSRNRKPRKGAALPD